MDDQIFSIYNIIYDKLNEEFEDKFSRLKSDVEEYVDKQLSVKNIYDENCNIIYPRYILNSENIQYSNIKIYIPKDIDTRIYERNVTFIPYFEIDKLKHITNIYLSKICPDEKINTVYQHYNLILLDDPLKCIQNLESKLTSVYYNKINYAFGNLSINN
jgi:hypothetical protein